MSFFLVHQGWVLTAASSLMCLTGCSIIYLDLIYKFIFPAYIVEKYPFEITSNNEFLIASLSLSSGSILFTSLVKLLPNASDYLAKNDYLSQKTHLLNGLLVFCFIVGILIFLLLNTIIHRFTSESIIHCAHDHEDEESEILNHTPSSSNISDHDGGNHPSRSHDTQEETVKITTIEESEHLNETSPLLTTNNSSNSIKYDELQTFNALKILKHPFSQKKTNKSLVAYSPTETAHNNINKSLITLSRSSSIDNLLLVDETLLSQHDLHKSDHRHLNIETSVSKLFSIGLQTTLAISLHKFPEGFIYYTTSKIDEALSFNIFLSLAIHNISEGFSMTLPLYLSLNSRSKAILISGILGGFSQPIGALFGYLLLPKNSEDIDENLINLIFGGLMSSTAGFLTIIGLKMLLSSVGFAHGTKDHGFISFWFVVGLLIICFTNVLTGNLL